MMKEPLISVIVPVYNTEQYLDRCIQSILKQKETNFELLLIDDGSTDSSRRICDSYIRVDSRIRVFHKSNGGVSSARNLGLIHATGEWILFVDADDWLSDDYLTLDKTALHSDIIQKSYVIIAENHTVQEEHIVSSKVLNKQYDIYYFFLNKRNNALWDKFIHHSLIKEHRFDINVKVGEDFLFFLEILKEVHVYSFIPCGKYYYFQRRGSAMQSVNTSPELYINIIRYNIRKIIHICEGCSLEFILYSLLSISYMTLLTNQRFIKLLNTDDVNAIRTIYKNTAVVSLFHSATLKNFIRVFISRIKFIRKYGRN